MGALVTNTPLHSSTTQVSANIQCQGHDVWVGKYVTSLAEVGPGLGYNKQGGSGRLTWPFWLRSMAW